MKYLALSILSIIFLSRCKSVNKPENSIQNSSYHDDTALRFSSDGNYLLWSKGIDYHAFGENPNWILDIDLDSNVQMIMDSRSFSISIDNLLIYKHEDHIGYLASPVDESKVHKSASFLTPMDTSVILLIYNELCRPVTELKRRRTEVKVCFNTKDSLFLSGCGYYVPNYGLRDIYALDHAPGFDLAPEQFERGIPTLELHVRDLSFLGHNGCNDLSGKFTNEMDGLEFYDITSTEMACPQQSEFNFQRALTVVRYYERWEHGISLLNDRRELVMNLRKID